MLKRLKYIAAILLCLTACHGTVKDAPVHVYTEEEQTKQHLAEMVNIVYDEVQTMSATEILFYLAKESSFTREDGVINLNVNIAGLSIRGSLSVGILNGLEDISENDFSIGVFEGDTRLARLGLEPLPYTEYELWLPTLVFRFDDGTSVSWTSFLIDFYE